MSATRKALPKKGAKPKNRGLEGEEGSTGAMSVLQAWEPGVAAWFERPRAAVVVALICALLAFRSNHWDWAYGVLHYGGQDQQNLMAYDVRNHVSAINSAAAAIKEGTLVIREVPWFNFVAPPVFKRYPYFQFYGTCAYTTPALLVCLGVQAYHAFLIAGLLSFFFAFLGAYRVGKILGLRQIACLAGAAAYTFAPYHLTDWYGRVAFTETMGLALMPWVLYSVLRCSKDRSIAALLQSTVLWAWLMTTHTILHLLAAIFFFAVLVLGWALEDREDLGALLRPFAAYAFACLCAAWALWPVARFGHEFGVASAFYPQDWAWASNLRVLFSPFYYSTPKNDGFIGLQIGWPLVAATVAGFWMGRRRPLWAVYAGLITFCVFLAWSPIDLWKYMGSLQIIQFPYRVLGAVITLGSALVAVAWDRGMRRFDGLGFIGLVVLLLIVSAGYFARGGAGMSAEQLSTTYGREGFLFEGRRYPYTIDNPNSTFMQAHYPSAAYDLSALTYTANAPGDTVLVNAAEPLALTPTVEYGSWTTVKVPSLKKGSVVQLPAAWYPGMYRLKVNGRSQDYGRVANRLAYQADADGDLELSYHFAGMASSNAVSYLAWLAFLFLGFKAWRGEELFPAAPAAPTGSGPKPRHPRRAVAVPGAKKKAASRR